MRKVELNIPVEYVDILKREAGLAGVTMSALVCQCLELLDMRRQHAIEERKFKAALESTPQRGDIPLNMSERIQDASVSRLFTDADEDNYWWTDLDLDSQDERD